MKKSIFVIAAAAAVGFASMASAATTFLAAGGGAAGNYNSLGDARYTNLAASLNGTGIDSNAGGEKSVREIADAWGALLGLNLTFTRIFDTGVVNPLNPNIGTVPAPLTSYTDAIWGDGVVDIALKATFAGQTQRIGTLSGVGSANSAYTSPNGFFDIGGVDGAVLTTGTIRTNGTPFRFGRSEVGQASSAQNSNQNPDKMISFLVTDAGGILSAPTYAIFFDDAGGDLDFNDGAILFDFAGRGVIPLPGASLMGFALLGGLGLARVRRSIA